MKKNHIFSLIVSIFFVFFIQNPALADVPTTGALDTIMNQFISNSNHWFGVLSFYAIRLFWILAGIDFAWMAIMLILSMGDISDFAAQTVRKIIVLGFFLMLLVYGNVWAKDIINSFIQAGGQANANAGGAGAAYTTPSAIFETGYQLCAVIFDAMSFTTPVELIPYAIGAIIIMIVFSLIAAMMLMIYVQAYIVINAGVILLGFGGISFTREVCLKYLQAALSTGIKLFLMILIVGLCQAIMQSWFATFSNVNIKGMCLIIGVSIVFLALVKTIPDMVGDLINGFSWGTGESLSRTAFNAGRFATSAALGTAAVASGGFMAVKEAAKLHNVQSSTGTTSSGLVWGATKNLASAALNDASGKVTGRVRNFGTMGGRMAASMQESRLSTPTPNKEPSEDERYISPAVDLTKGRDGNE